MFEGEVAHLVKELFPRGRRLDRELEFGVHGRHAHGHLPEMKERL